MSTTHSLWPATPTLPTATVKTRSGSWSDTEGRGGRSSILVSVILSLIKTPLTLPQPSYSLRCKNPLCSQSPPLRETTTSPSHSTAVQSRLKNKEKNSNLTQTPGNVQLRSFSHVLISPLTAELNHCHALVDIAQRQCSIHLPRSQR